ncbi:hypothetical protein LLS47_23735 [Rouxiella badensis]|uniref:hypothetical protein n=1 Tax=Rouxiella badensis TaxID=1646377 RepID=UPI001D142295|nr:hypothetical protein [Rouxiella badensis]MCC3735915.1 hypothetical protein [Rouxiella badensis]MCC3761312.1 hypothetical protein [Rouxiella badensis]
MSEQNKKKGLFNKVADSKVTNFLLPIKKPKKHFEEALKFKNTRTLLKIIQTKKEVDYVPFEELCKKNELSEHVLKHRYVIMSWFTLASLLFFVGWLSYTVLSFFQGEILSGIRGFGTSIASFGLYFWCAVDTYCFRTRQTYSKFSFLSSIEHIVPNPFHEFAEVSKVEEEGKAAKKLKAYLLSKKL